MERFAAILEEARAGRLPPRVALAHLIAEAPDRAALDEALGAEPALGRLRALLRAHPGAFEAVRRASALARHDVVDAADPVARWSAIFDRLAREEPEAGVALHCLGDPEALARSTAEIVEDLAAEGLLRAGATVVDVGCGTGRVLAALAPRVGFALGLDVSEGMLARARARCAGLRGAALARTSGRDLAALAPGSADLVLFVDSLPYAVLAGPDAAAGVVADAARGLRRGGVLVAYNVAYGGDEAAVFADLCAGAGLVATRAGERPFRAWDGSAFAARRP